MEWICTVCGYVHKGDLPPSLCPVCNAPSVDFKPADSTGAQQASLGGGVPAESRGGRDGLVGKLAIVANLARTGRSENAAMGTQKAFPDWDHVLFKGAQLSRMPLNEDEPASLRTVIGGTAKHPLEISLPIYVSHMSFGALSREAKIALARGSRKVGTAMCSGEGGLLPAERDEAGLYVYELGTAAFSHRDEAVLKADAVEIKIGQAAKPGIGGHLPKEKVTAEIAAIRGLGPGEGSASPARHAGIEDKDDLHAEVERLRRLTGGKPVGVKISAGHVEDDLLCALYANPDFVTLDCRGGSTGSSPAFVRDNACMPPVFAIHRARKCLDAAGSRATLCVTGGFRDSMDVAKALAMGADAVALATASLVAIGCRQYRVCHTGRCPVGIATQDPELRKRMDVDRSVEMFVNFYEGTRSELATIARLNGRSDIHDLDLSDIFTTSAEISGFTDIEHA